MTVRPVQTSLIEGMDRPVGRIIGSVMSGTNADLIHAVAPLYLTGSVLDVTYGEGKWWDRFKPIDRESHYGWEGDLVDEIAGGLREACRVARAFVLVKCMEFVSSREFHDMPTTVIHEAGGLGWWLHDRIVHHTGSGPGGHNIFDVKRARRHHSYLLVFAKAGAA